MEELLKEQQRTNELLQSLIHQNKNTNELLIIEQVHKEFGIRNKYGRKIFNGPELPVQRYTTPFKVTRQALNDYMNKEHDYLSERV